MSRGQQTDIMIPNMEPGQPVWALATLFPAQGEWTEEDYFRLETGRLVELVNRCLEVLPLPTWLHQRIVAWLFGQFSQWNLRHGRCEVLSDGAEARQRDLCCKRDDYARAGIQEYWIVDPLDKSVCVLQLDGQGYREHGKYYSGEIAASAVLKGLEINCSTIWALEDGLPS